MMKSVFSYRNGVLCAEAMPLVEIAEQVDTPFYCSSVKQLCRNVAAFSAGLSAFSPDIYYAVKANGTLAVIRTLAEAGCGVEITSSGELERAMAAGVPPAKMLFSGVGKSRDDLAAGLLAGVGRIVIHSISELILVDQVASILDKKASLSLCLNMGRPARTVEGKTLSRSNYKFGLPLDRLAEALRLCLSSPCLSFSGFAVHVGSNLSDAAVYRDVFEKLVSVVHLVRGQGIPVLTLDLGGGLGVPKPEKDFLPDYAAVIGQTVGALDCALSVSPGRRLVGDAGVLVTRILHVKDTGRQKILVVDAGTNDLVRPAQYGSVHEIIPVREKSSGPLARVAVVGPVSEVSDQFGDRHLLPPMRAGDLVAIMQAGAYGSARASTYNGRALVPEVLVSAAHYAVVRRRIAVAEQMEWEGYPEWMEAICAA